MRHAENPHYDVIIIGAGSIGTPASFNLARAGFKTLVIDRAASVGQGSNKRAIGGIRATHSDPAKIRISLRSLDIYSTWKKIYGDEIEWRPGGYVFVAYHQREEGILKELLNRQKLFGLNIDWLDKTQLLEVAPDLNPHDLIGGTFSPEDGSASPLLAIHAFYRQAVQAGVVFHFNETIEEIITRNGRVAGVKTNRGEYGADWVVNAAGSSAQQIAQMVGLEVPVNPDSHEAAITEPVARFLDPLIVDIRPLPGSSNFYFYQHHSGQIIFCITPSPAIWGEDVRETSSFLPMVAQRMISVMPRLQHIRVRRTWRGLYPMTPDGFPIVGYAKGVEGFILAVGMCGQGFMLGPGLGELIVRLIQGTTDPSDQEILTILSPYRKFDGQEMLK